MWALGKILPVSEAIEIMMKLLFDCGEFACQLGPTLGLCHKITVGKVAIPEICKYP